MSDMSRVISQILRDIKVELSDEFDRNFERQGFFSERWKRSRRSTAGGGATLIDTGKLRRSITSRSDAASMWKYMALMKVGSTIKMPKRRFLGASVEVERAVRDIVEENIAEYVGNELIIKIQEDF